ncbi:Sulfite reductase [NADPH] flavoprotein alpha-component [Rubripirellula lacrimiformis]|uniref:assimilatory sulfite reductase (NADPH) n=1 Tax=Rubripirellula lacrimiformis TaxID=1930273 RepID=A0A517NLL3_9BACT|nr:sulfite reductase subunit alpha [Rubripirellula lacrimiformis]QDT08020.1 Sulfite reductase [NADPH] flavoprotein alpha-component [Rubripirellula lacrimiformis]
MSSMIPTTAPFNDEQRAWLNGFFSGLMGIQENAQPESVLSAAGLSGTSLPIPEPAEEEFPWHDDSLPIVDRMELAEGKPVPRRLMAAMAQLDCGSCGYVCQTYAEAIASGEETNLTLCSPGGKETKQMVKRILKESGDDATGNGAPTDAAPTASVVADRTNRNGAATNGASANGSATHGAATNGRAVYSRTNPFVAKLIESRPLNQPGSAKDTRHVAIDLAGSGLKYEVGDALGIYPSNCDDLVTQVIDRIGADQDLPVSGPSGSKSLQTVLSQDYCLKEPSDELLEAVLEKATDPEIKEALTAMLEDGVPDGVDVLDVLDLTDCRSITATEFLDCLDPLNPRLYSIASSMKCVGDQVHLTIGKVVYEREGRVRKGVASTMLADRVEPGTTVRVFVQPNHGGFTVPANAETPIVMVGPGTGIAPFIAFLQERQHSQAAGNNWLFFGDQHESTDFLYEDELRSYVENGLLARLDTAFSRDGDAKVYVQDRMRQSGAELWDWLQSGACFYVCGDASRMAADVEKSLLAVIQEYGNLEPDQAKSYLDQMKSDQRYVRDVY